ncbi:MAG: hypothetical protein ABIL25_02285 [candidate division WOR-3 bacterium]
MRMTSDQRLMSKPGTRQWPAIRSCWLFTTGCFLLLVVFVAGCGTEPPPRWPWWTAQDSAAVRLELGRWKDVFSANHAMRGGLEYVWRSRLSSKDSTSTTGDTLYKFARLLSFSLEPTDSGHADVYQFGVTVDTLALKDTFCEVTYYDSMAACRAVFGYDSLWVVGFRPDTQISGTPPETTIIFRPSYTELRGFEQPVIATKGFAWKAMRKLFLARDTMPDTLYYELRKATGFAVYAPSATDAPSISRVIFSRPGRVDTVFYSPRLDGRGLYNLKSLNSLYTVRPGEEVTVSVVTTTPPDTTTEKNRFLLYTAGKVADITASARNGQGVFSFADTGYHHVYIKVVPLSNLLYPEADYVETVWAIPVRVANP